MTQQPGFSSSFGNGHKPKSMKGKSPEQLSMVAILQPESELEHRLLSESTFLKGLDWGVPRYGHPEGEVYKHIAEVLQNIDCLSVDPQTRSQLRLIALVHDTFKYLEDKGNPRDWSKHHGILARNFMASFTDDKTLLTIIELHDEAYYCWRHIHLYRQAEEGQKRLNKLLDTLGDDLQLFYLFFKCDTLTGDKNPAPLKWFEKTIQNIELVSL